VIVQETAFSPAVTISLAFRAGSLYEPDDLPGSRGSSDASSIAARARDRPTRSPEASTIAASRSGSDEPPRASLSCTCLRRTFDDVLACWRTSRATRRSPDEIEKRRAETITAIRQDQDNPASARRRAAGVVVRRRPSVRASAERAIADVERFSREDLLAHHAARFAPSTLCAIIVGDVQPSGAMARVEEVFDGWAATPGPSVTFRRSAAPPATRITIDMPEKSQSDIAYGFTSISRLDPTYCAHWMMNTILGQFGLGGRLAENIRERQGMAYYAYSAFDPSVGPGPLVIRAGVDPANVARASRRSTPRSARSARRRHAKELARRGST
jgi:zinc protease